MQDQQQQPDINEKRGMGKNLTFFMPHPFTQTSEYQFLSRVYKLDLKPEQSPEDYLSKIHQLRETFIIINLPNYAFARAHHYHFFLDQFQRISGQSSYALESQSANFGFTFSQDQKLYKGQKLGDIINRTIFTLPSKQSDRDYFTNRKVGQSHNQAHRMLFSNQNGKFELDRFILTCKKILNNFQKLHQPSYLKQFQLIRSNGALQFLLQNEYSLDQKRELLQNFLSGLQQGKQQKLRSYEVNDFIYYRSSLQQKLHDLVEAEQRVDNKIQRKMIRNLINKQIQTRNNLNQPDLQDFRAQVKKMLLFHKTNNMAVTEQTLQSLLQYFETIKDREKVMMPIGFFYFGGEEIRSKVNIFISHYLHNTECPYEDSVIQLMCKLFNQDFYLNQELGLLNFLDSKFLVEKIVPELKDHFRGQRNIDVPRLDQYLNFDVLTDPQAQFSPLFALNSHKIVVSQYQAKVIIYYNRICKTFKLFEPFIHEHQSLMEILCSPYLQNLLQGIIGYIPKKMIAKLPHLTKHLISQGIIASLENSGEVYLEFQFNKETGFGLLWNPPKPESQSQVEQSQPLNEDEEIPFKMNEQEVPLNLLVMKPSVSHNLFESSRLPQPQQQPQPQIPEDPELVQLEDYPFTKRVKPSQNDQQS